MIPTFSFSRAARPHGYEQATYVYLTKDSSRRGCFTFEKISCRLVRRRFSIWVVDVEGSEDNLQSETQEEIPWNIAIASFVELDWAWTQTVVRPSPWLSTLNKCSHRPFSIQRRLYVEAVEIRTASARKNDSKAIKSNIIDRPSSIHPRTRTRCRKSVDKIR